MTFVLRALCVAIAIIGALGAVSTFADAHSAAIAWGAVSAMAIVGLLFTDALDRRRAAIEAAAKALAAQRSAIKGLAQTLGHAAADIAAAAAEASDIAEALS